MDVKFLMIRQNVTLCVMKAVNIQAFEKQFCKRTRDSNFSP